MGERLAILRDHGIAPEIREYMKEPLSREEIAALVGEVGVPARDAVRWSEPGSSGRSSGPSAPANAAAGEAREAEKEVAEAGITPDSPDAALLDAMVKYPVLLNRPSVRTNKGEKLCRPSETVKGRPVAVYCSKVIMPIATLRRIAILKNIKL